MGLKGIVSKFIGSLVLISGMMTFHSGTAFAATCDICPAGSSYDGTICTGPAGAGTTATVCDYTCIGGLCCTMQPGYQTAVTCQGATFFPSYAAQCDQTASYSTTYGQCGSGLSLNGSNCEGTVSHTSTTGCPTGSNLSGGKCKMSANACGGTVCDYTCQGASGCVSSPCLNNGVTCQGATYSTSWGGTCTQVGGSYTASGSCCPMGFTLNGTQCEALPQTGCASPSPSPSPTSCACTASTCPVSTTKYYFSPDFGGPQGGSFIYFMGQSGSSAGTPTVCNEASSTPGYSHNLDVGCSATAPGGLYDTCTDNPTINYYRLQSLSSFFPCGWNSNVSYCSAAVSPSPSPGSTPSGSPSCDYSSGGAGRRCAADLDCCTGYTCELAGAQAMSLYPGAPDADISKVQYVSNFVNPTASPPADYMLQTGTPIPVGAVTGFGSTTSGPSKVCVPTLVPPNNFLPPSPQTQLRPSLVVAPGGVAAPSPQNSAILWNATAKNYQCYLNQTDAHRAKVSGVIAGCSCVNGYEPVVMSQTYTGPFDELGSLYRPNKKLDSMWASILELIENNKAAVSVAKSAYNIVVPDSNAGPPPPPASFAPNSYDFGTVVANGVSAPKSITIKNKTLNSYTNCIVTIDSAADDAFILNNTNNCTNLAAGGSCTVSLIASPPDTASYTTTLTLTCGALFCASIEKKTKSFDFIVDLGKKVQEYTIKAKDTSVAGLEKLDDLLVGTSLACTPPSCPISTYCDCAGWATCNNPAPFVSQAACYCSVGYNIAKYCASPSPGPSPSTSMCFTSGIYSVNASSTPAGTATPSASATAAPSPGATKPLLKDYGAIDTAASTTINWNPWDGTIRKYGTYSPTSGPLWGSSFNIAKKAGVSTGVKALGCFRECPDSTVDPAHPAHRACWDLTDATNPACLTGDLCVCDNATDLWDQTNWRCVACAEGQYLDPATGACTCPYQYNLRSVAGVLKCRPDLLGYSGDATTSTGNTTAANDDPNKTEFVRNSKGGANKQYPVCGTGRMPVRYDLQISNVAGTDTPLTDAVTSDPKYMPPAFKYAMPIPTPTSTPNLPNVMPHYVYHDYLHCVCMAVGDKYEVATGAPILSASVSPPQSISTATAGGMQRFGGDTLDVISQRGPDGKPNAIYGPVTIANDNGAAIDGRMASAFGSTSKCGCPNVNEEMVAIDPLDPLTGYHCLPAMSEWKAGNLDKVMFAQTFNPTYHKGVLVMNAGNEQKSGGVIVDKIQLGPSTALQAPTQLYQRGIWQCQLGYTFGAGGSCTFDDSSNTCDGSSETSGLVTGASYAARFTNAVNKKLNCCGFQFGPAPGGGGSPVKFDCVENDKNGYANFDALWASADAATDGGQMNAIELADRSGRLLTGWYTLDGARCSQYTSFAPTVVRGELNPMIIQGQRGSAGGSIVAGAFSSKGTLTHPTGQGWTDMINGYGTAGVTPSAPKPSTNPVGALTCPVYIRAAAMYGCPDNAINSPYKRTYINGAKRQCAAAERTQIHIRIEQMFDIMGTKTMTPIDTVLDTTQVKNITLKELWLVNGFGTCPNGATQTGDACTY